MALILADRVRDTSSTTGTGAVTVTGTAPTGYRTFSAVCSTSDTLPYFIQHRTADEWEVGTGTYSASNQITRTTVLSSSNSNAAVSFSAGTKDVVLAPNATSVSSPGGSTGQVQYNNSGAFGGTNLYVESANLIAKRNSTTAQGFQVYNTYTDASNYEVVNIDFTTTANKAVIESTAAGTGTIRPLRLKSGGGNFDIQSFTAVCNLDLSMGGNGILDPSKIRMIPEVVSGLGSASPAGVKKFVSDATATTFASIVAGGGANNVPVYSDGTNWRIG